MNANNTKETKGLHKIFRIRKPYSYIFIFAAIAFGILGFIDLLNIYNDIVNRTSAFQFMMLCAIFGLMLRHYYKAFEEPNEK